MSRRRTIKHEVRVGLLLLAALAVFAWMSVQIGALQGLGNTISVTLVLDDAAGLVPDASVKVAGVQVGSVRDLAVDFDTAVATISLRKNAELRTDVRAQVRARSLLGEKYLALTPKSTTAPLLGDGDVISTVVPTVEIDDLIAALGPALAAVDPEDVARLVSSAADVSVAVGTDADALVSKTRELLDQLNEAASIAPTLKKDVPALLTDLRRTTSDLQVAIARADALLVQAEGTLGKVDEAATDAPAAVADVRRLLAELEPGVDDLRSTMEQSDEAMADIRKILDNFENFDEAALKRLLREEGVLVRLKAPPKGKGKGKGGGSNPLEK
ncbi:MAG: MCE family protein [Proteobacteria bacterium]|nr:MCE family protein [Pseudomonadota bacterium]